MATIATIHIGLGGHLGPLSRLGAELGRQGHRVLAFAPEREEERVAGDGVELIPHEPITRSDILGGLPGFTARLGLATERCVPELLDVLLESDVELVIHDAHAPWGLVSAEFLGLPRIVSDPLFPLAAGPSAGSQAALAIADPGRSLRESAATYPGGLEAAFSQIDSSRAVIARAWGVDLGGWLSMMHCGGDLTVGYTTPEILGPVTPRSGWCGVGPLMETRERAEARPRPLVYVALGTFFNYRRDVFASAIEALADEPVEVIVSTGRGWVSPADLEPLPGNVTVHSFVDSRAVLAEAAVHVTHGGGSSMNESFLAGVPVVCVPQGSDQAAWSWCAARLGAGEVVDPSPAAIGSGVRRLLTDAGYRRRAEAVGRHLSDYDGPARVAAVVQQALDHELGGRGVSSPSSRG